MLYNDGTRPKTPMTKTASKTQAQTANRRRRPANYDELKGRVISENFDAFQKELPKLLKKHREWYAVLRDKKVVGVFRTMDEAGPFGRENFPDGMYSIQAVTDQPIDFGIFSSAPLKR